MDENYPKLVQLCAGLPHVGDRELAENERAELLGEARKSTRRFVLLMSSVVVYIVIIVFIAWNPYEFYLHGLFVLLMILPLFFAVPFAILIGYHSYNDSQMLKEASKDGTVHCFEGSLHATDWTDGNIQILQATNLLLPDSDRQTVELFSRNKFVFKINGVRPKVLQKLSPTLASMPEPVAPYFALPSAWIEPEFSQAFERRRLSKEESREIVSYAGRMRRWAGFIIFMTLFGSKTLYQFLFRMMELPPSSCFRIAAITGLVIGGLLVVRQELRVRKVLRDAEFGWAFVHLPVEEGQGDNKKIEDTVAVEFLPESRLIWRIDEKPAGWRGQI